MYTIYKSGKIFYFQSEKKKYRSYSKYKFKISLF